MGYGFYNLAMVSENHHFSRFPVQFTPKRPIAYDYTILSNQNHLGFNRQLWKTVQRFTPVLANLPFNVPLGSFIADGMNGLVIWKSSK